MSRIGQKFDELKAAGKKGFVPFVTAGDPDLETTLEILHLLADRGADIIELGVPFSDPMADGPTIQRASQRALEKGVNLSAIIKLVRDFRRSSEVPIVLFSYFNPLYRYRIERLRYEAADAGIDGILITDVIGDEFTAMAESFGEKQINFISLVAPTSTDERLKEITASARGFIYAVSRAGVTGARGDTSSSAAALVDRVKKISDLPVAVGFGISTRAQIEEVWRYADAAVVGSAIVAEIEKCNGVGVIETLDEFLNELLPPRQFLDQRLH